MFLHVRLHLYALQLFTVAPTSSSGAETVKGQIRKIYVDDYIIMTMKMMMIMSICYSGDHRSNVLVSFQPPMVIKWDLFFKIPSLVLYIFSATLAANDEFSLCAQISWERRLGTFYVLEKVGK